MMLEITDRARVELESLLTRVESEDPTSRPRAFRLVPQPSEPSGGPAVLALTVDEPRAGDVVVRHEERDVLVLDPLVSARVEGLVLDVVSTADGPRLGFARQTARRERP
jgi:hypothetical protein